MLNTFDFSTIYTAILTSNVLLAIIAVIIKNEKVMINAGYKLITIFLILTAARFLLPIQFPFVTTIPLPEGISSIFIPLFNPLFTVLKINVTPIRLIAFVWIIGIFVQAYRYYKVNLIIRKHILSEGNEVTTEHRYANIMYDICGKKNSHIRIFELSDIESPLIFGLFKPYILLPDKFSCTDKELYFVLRHEIAHYLHHDLIIKFFIKLLIIIYWWNPFGYLLYNQTNLLLEMRIDDSVTDSNEKDTYEYLQCLLHLAEYQGNNFKNSLGNAISFTRKNENILTKRFKMLLQRKQKKNHIFNISLFCLVTIIYLSSYMYILEARVNSSDVNQIMFDISELNSFLIDNGDGTYDLYLSGYKVETLDSLEHYRDDIPIITKEEYESAQK